MPHQLRAFAKRSAFQNNRGCVGEIVRPLVALPDPAESMETDAKFVLGGSAAGLLKKWMAAVERKMCAGWMMSSTATAMAMATPTEAGFVRTATLAAITLSVAGNGTLEGGA